MELIIINKKPNIIILQWDVNFHVLNEFYLKSNNQNHIKSSMDRH